SGANNAIRELGGVFGVAVLAAVFSHYGGYQTPDSFVHGVTPALYLGAAIVAIGAAAALFIPRPRRQPSPAVSRLAWRARLNRRVSLVAGTVLVGGVAATASVTAATTSATTTASRQGAAPELTLTMPVLTGPYRVGTRSLELVDRSRREPGSNGRRPRALVG